jgi:hypothetical protein
MELLKQSVEKFNTAIEEEYYHLKFGEPASNELINEIQNFYSIPIPIELKNFYELGAIKNDADEDYSVWIQSATDLIKSINEENKWFRIHSSGIIDGIKFSWGNDRPEFDEVNQEDIDKLNENYKYVGLYRYDWGLEEAYYIYFDKNQKFGVIRYHQDGFEDLWEDHLDTMLNQSPANQSLEELLISMIDKLEKGILEDE